MKIIGPLLFVMLLSACHVPRFFTRNKANITDHKIFPKVDIPASDDPFRFAEGPTERLENLMVKGKKGEQKLDDYLRDQTSTTAFLVIQNDSILFENYYRQYERDEVSNIFSVSKSVTSLLVGLAVDDGFIEDVHDPITKYIPELLDADPTFQRLTILHLLNMRSGLNFREAYGSPFAHVAKLYYGTNQLKQLSKYEFSAEPGTVHRYQSASTALLGTAVEKATGKLLGEYLAEKIWQPLGMEHAASWSVDDKKDPSTKAYCCLNTTARDLAKIGRLYLNKGQWEGEQIISEDWVKASITPNMDNGNYQYQWYSLGGVAYMQGKEMVFPDSLSAVQKAQEVKLEHFYVDRKTDSASDYHIHYATNEFYALGIMNQLVYVNPELNLIIVRLGKKYDQGYFGLFRKIRSALRKE